ncbi:LVIVD repeat-containing protein [Psychroserpens algicola]|uniref:LVIVD repeat-containing protein n=1 Tax=Psychroserpens algicola TaxID=1719034 RepID=A0ABT0HAD6_9FLAO|nr:hypothetical protein [Psychroserpens algicola]MCK8481320.1 hypothetical protein [Psychroserpens algicola]
MRKLILLLVIVCCWSCKNDDSQFEIVTVAIPETISKMEFRSSVVVEAPKPILNVGKIYAYQNYIFINEKYKGVHIIDNTNPSSPQTIAFINIPGNEDISIKNDVLYADSAVDLVVFDISDVNSISEIERIEDVFSVYDYQIPNEAQEVDFGNFNAETDVIIGWTLDQQQREFNDINTIDTFDGAEASNGVGGSLARFQIVDNYLYTVGEFEMTVFSIANLSEPTLVYTDYAGWNIETMFYADGYLYLGGTNGMFIHSLENPAAPQMISEFTHWEGCDPVVVDGDYAYLTLRGGNDCGQDLSVLEVIDVSDKTQPTLVAQHTLDNPYGLGFKGNQLFVCDGTSGLKIFDKTNPLDLQIIDTFTNVQATDVIPLEDRLLMISDTALYQYGYETESSIVLVSTFILN